MQGTTLYSSKAGLEVRAVSSLKKRGSYQDKYGRVRLRAFSLEKGSESIRVILTPQESHKLSRVIKHLIKEKPDKGITAIVHKVAKSDGDETTSKVTVEFFKTKKGSEGVGFVVSRDGSRVNVALSKDDALYLADLLHHLSMSQSWWDSKKVEDLEEEEIVEEEEEEVPEETGGEPEEDIPF